MTRGDAPVGGENEIVLGSGPDEYRLAWVENDALAELLAVGDDDDRLSAAVPLTPLHDCKSTARGATAEHARRRSRKQIDNLLQLLHCKINTYALHNNGDRLERKANGDR